MFWIETATQLGLFGEDEVIASTNISKLVAFAEQQFPTCDANFHRQFAFLSHNATVNFLTPMLIKRFGSLNDAKEPTIAWLENVGSFDTIARATRDGRTACNTAIGLKKKGIPEWYQKYLKSEHFQETKQKAFAFYQEFMGTVTCLVNARHEFEVFHHTDYTELGRENEFRFLAPYCQHCHCAITARGPSVSAYPPEDVKPWI